MEQEKSLENFAKKLIDKVGYEGAMQACYDNQWLGALSHIQKNYKNMKK